MRPRAGGGNGVGVGEGFGDEPRIAGEPPAILVRLRILPLATAQLQLHLEQFAEQVRSLRAVRFAQPLLDPRPAPPIPGPLEPVAGGVDADGGVVVVEATFAQGGWRLDHDGVSPSSQSVRITSSFRPTVLTVQPIRAAISGRR